MEEKSTKVYYFGDDEAYYRSLLTEFKRRSKIELQIEKIFESDEKRIQSLFVKTFNERPACVFIDFSKHTADYLHLARLFTRTPMEYNLITVGLVDYLSPPETLQESILTGVNFTHIKSTETYDAVFDAMKLFAPDEIPEHDFAKAALKETWEAGVPAKVGYINNEGVHLETDFRLERGNRIKMKNFWGDKKIIPSKDLFVQNISTSNLFYQFKYAVDAEFLYVNEFIPPEGMNPTLIELKKRDRNDLIVNVKKHLGKWIEENLTSSLEKKAKLLVIDRKFAFYDNQPRADKHSYTIRCIPSIPDPEGQLDKLEPQVIAFALEGKESPNNSEALYKLIEAVKNSTKDTSPFIVIFNCAVDSAQARLDFNYAQLMVSKSELSVELLIKMAEIYDKKRVDLFPKTKLKPQTVYLKKSNPASIAEIMIDLTITSISETDMIFRTDREIPVGINLRITNPIPMYINVQPLKKPAVGNFKEYCGLIHSIGEKEKSDLRKFINSVFFRDHDSRQEIEMADFKRLNEIKLNERLENERKKEEQIEEAKRRAEEDRLREQEEQAKKKEMLEEAKKKEQSEASESKKPS